MQPIQSSRHQAEASSSSAPAEERSERPDRGEKGAKGSQFPFQFESMLARFESMNMSECFPSLFLIAFSKLGGRGKGKKGKDREKGDGEKDCTLDGCTCKLQNGFRLPLYFRAAKQLHDTTLQGCIYQCPGMLQSPVFFPTLFRLTTQSIPPSRESLSPSSEEWFVPLCLWCFWTILFASERPFSIMFDRSV